MLPGRGRPAAGPASSGPRRPRPRARQRGLLLLLRRARAVRRQAGRPSRRQCRSPAGAPPGGGLQGGGRGASARAVAVRSAPRAAARPPSLCASPPGRGAPVPRSSSPPPPSTRRRGASQPPTTCSAALSPGGGCGAGTFALASLRSAERSLQSRPPPRSRAASAEPGAPAHLEPAVQSRLVRHLRLCSAQPLDACPGEARGEGGGRAGGAAWAERGASYLPGGAGRCRQRWSTSAGHPLLPTPPSSRAEGRASLAGRLTPTPAPSASCPVPPGGKRGARAVVWRGKVRIVGPVPILPEAGLCLGAGGGGGLQERDPWREGRPVRLSDGAPTPPARGRGRRRGVRLFSPEGHRLGAGGLSPAF